MNIPSALPLLRSFALLLIGMANTYAANDTFDPSTSMLTIPSVTVGTTTFTNVIVRLNDYNVLAVDPNPLQGISVSGFLYQFQGCEMKASALICRLTLTSQNQDRLKNINSGSDLSIQMTDDRGNAYVVSFLQVANLSSTGNPATLSNFTFVADTPVAVSFQFSNIATNATAVALLKVGPATVKNYPFR